MKAMFAIAGAAALVAGGVHVSGVLKSGEIYAKPFAVAYAELAATPLPPMITGMFPGAPRIVRKPGSIEWHFGEAGHDGATFTAFVASEDSGHSRVSIKVDIDKRDDKIAGPYLNSPLMLNIGRQAMAEQVAAELEDRPFSQLRYGQRLSAYMAAHPGDLQAYGETIRGTMNDVATQVNGYPSKAVPNRQSLGDTLAGFGQASAQMDAETIRDAQSWSSGSSSSADTGTPIDPAQTRVESTRPATDLSTYR